jgi:hypothetical protein
MALRILIIGPPELEAIARVVDFASRPENLYRPLDPTPKTPGNDPGYMLHLGDFRIVYSLTQSNTVTIFRHLSVSVPNSEMLPHPAAVEAIMERFGFAGGLNNCEVIGHPAEHCITVGQPIDQSLREVLN